MWKIQDKLVDGNEYSKALETIIHKTIKKVSADIETMKYNTAIAALMTLLNEFEEQNSITKADLRTFLLLLNPFAPHITEEINELQHLGEPIYLSKWPTYDENKIVAETFDLVIQVNGKVRAKLIANKGLTEQELIDLALVQDNVKRHIANYEIIKTIVVPDKLVNIVVK